MRGPMGGPQILSIKEVQQELNLSTSQIQRIQQMLDANRPQRGERPAGPPNPETMRELQQKIQRELRAILDDSQYRRYGQLDLQASGPRAFQRPEVIERLKLSDQQLGQIRDLMGANRPKGEFQEGPPRGEGPGGPPRGEGPGGPPPGQFQGGPRPNPDEMMQKVLAILTADQRQKWLAMTGKKFNFPMPPRR